ncbi:hypothetical protein MC7420_1574 [Coleofasciculus chthonoplastes PCC 7420]|uniref:Uncharacterized protein n=1 Tax=Coleofasciculus chthonoplastes PCC 7420 TaxID=118168 RepID=B4W314_9CYAN|nr:hypothetical protein MC7420_1574 [Coleofasciculus chthonoplastes PCC 7420]
MTMGAMSLWVLTSIKMEWAIAPRKVDYTESFQLTTHIK